MCPKCNSTFLKIKHRRGFERMLVFLTGKRKYYCTDCGTVYRAIDRRRLTRESEMNGAQSELVAPRHAA